MERPILGKGNPLTRRRQIRSGLANGLRPLTDSRVEEIGLADRRLDLQRCEAEPSNHGRVREIPHGQHGAQAREHQAADKERALRPTVECGYAVFDVLG